MDAQTLKKYEKAAKLSLTDAEAKTMLADTNSFLERLNSFNNIPTQNAEPLIYPQTHTQNVLREDIHVKFDSREDLLKRAPETDGEYFIVPKVMD
ncbi:MAG: Asp-tRNA(Asn)/Glu-tRNA(Gln) amidotransferase subunit GatC [Firmicutes bacterium]|nr:Asp-tRNA(Asn)/Glu-tRNA(Gln) amidotransferase subunit GatC [Bacillota bacterium]